MLLVNIANLVFRVDEVVARKHVAVVFQRHTLAAELGLRAGLGRHSGGLRDCRFKQVDARGPPLWDDGGDAQMGDGAQIEPADWDLVAQPAPDFEVDQRINW